MPYIAPELRQELDPLIDALAQRLAAQAGESDGAFTGLLNYACTRLALSVIRRRFGRLLGLGGAGDNGQALRRHPGQKAPAGRLEQRFRSQQAQHLLGVLGAAERPEPGARPPGQDDAKKRQSL